MSAERICEICGTPQGRLMKDDGPGGMTRMICVDAVACMERRYLNDPDLDAERFEAP